jgi:hypothetical protein
MKLTKIALALLASGMAMSLGAQGVRKPYLIKLAAEPAATYAGGVAGYAATAPAPGARLDAAQAHVQQYLGYLQREVDRVAATVPSAKVLHRYGATVAGFAAMLTDAEVAKLRTDPAVERIEEDRAETVDTSFTTSQFLGLGQPGGAWSQLDANGRAIQGEGIVIGVIDGGAWPENPSFHDHVDAAGRPVPAATPGARLAYDPLPASRWRGACVGGPGFPATSCNHKLVGARFYNASFTAFGPPYLNFEFQDSPRDSNGHGVHTSSTAGGNAGAVYTIGGSSFEVAGVAPRARIAAYKTCWSVTTPTGFTGSCFAGDRQAAIDQAVLDGVDVLNVSIGLGGGSVTDIVSTAMRNATRAGVFVAASAGNSGPGNAVNASGPWITTTANSTHSRTFEATVALGNGSTVAGASWQSTGLTSREIVLARDAGVVPFAALATEADRLAISRCYTAADRADPALNPLGAPSANAAIDPAKVAGRIVLCFRGGNTFANKLAATSGAAGMIFQNIPASGFPAGYASADSRFANIYPIPTVHLPAAVAVAVIGYAGTAGATAAIAPRVQNPTGQTAPVMADSSSRGPNLFDVNVLKPDLTAPGTDIIAGHVTEGFNAAMRDAIVASNVAAPGGAMISGTSMASPHVAGTAALLKQVRPGWSVGAIKSAIMTSTSQDVRLASGAPDGNRFGFGAGHLRPNAALATNVVYDVTPAQFDAYAAGTLSGTQLNLASITAGNIIGTASQRRTLTNKGTSSVTLAASVQSPPGFQALVSPAAVTLAPGASASFTVQTQRTTAPFNAYAFGTLTWAGSGQTLTSPLTARAVALAATTSVTDQRAAGSRLHTVATGFTGTLVQRPSGMVPARETAGSVVKGETRCVPVTVPAGALVLRAMLFDADTEGGALTDLDLSVVTPSGSTVQSGNTSSNELVTLSNPAPGTYSVCVEGFALAPNLGSARYTLSTWVVDPAAGPVTLTVAGGARVASGGLATLGLAWNAAATTRHLGIVRYSEAPSGPVIGSTTLFVDPVSGTRPALPVATLVVDKSQR